MTRDTDLPHQQPDSLQKPPRSFKSLNLLALIAAVLLIALVAGTGGYLLGSSNMQSIPLSHPSPPTTTAQSSVSTPSPISTQTIEDVDWKTHINEELGVSFNYPNDWKVFEEKQTGKVIIGPNITTCPSNVNPFSCETAESIYIEIIEDSAINVSLTEFLEKKYGQFKPTYTPIIIGGFEGLRTKDIPGQFGQENIFVKHNSKIYNFEWIKNLGTKRITQEVFNKVLSTLQFIR